LKKLFRKILVKKQIKNIKIYIKYLSDDLFEEFLSFLTHLNLSINTLKIQMKYNDTKIKEFKTKFILENLIKNENNNINFISFIDCHFNTEGNFNLLNEYITKNKTKLKNIFIFNISIDGIKIISNLLINSSLKKLNLSKNYLGDEGCSILSKGIKQNNSLISLNLSSNYIIYQGIIDIAQSMNSNKKNEEGIYNSTIKKINLAEIR
jgi:hypothetical protein